MVLVHFRSWLLSNSGRDLCDFSSVCFSRLCLYLFLLLILSLSLHVRRRLVVCILLHLWWQIGNEQQPQHVRENAMTWRPDPSFYPSPRMAMKAPAEKFAYVAAFDPTRQKPDAIAVVDVDPGSKTYANILGSVEMPSLGDELHHFGWNACSSCLCPNAPHPHVERRYLVVPGLRSSRMHIIDTKPDPKNPKVVKVIDAATMADRTGYSRPHTVHCGPGGIYVAALGNKDGKAPGGVFVMDHETFEPLGRWEVDRGPQ